jgi:hypothetical protein
MTHPHVCLMTIVNSISGGQEDEILNLNNYPHLIAVLLLF